MSKEWFCVRCGSKKKASYKNLCTNCYRWKYIFENPENHKKQKERLRKYYTNNKEMYSKKHKEYYKDKHEELNDKQRMNYYKNREEILKKQRVYAQKESVKQQKKKIFNDYIERNPKKRKARDLAKCNVLISKNQICEKCNNNKATERHHPDYSKPLEVIFLCKSCHYEIHRKPFKKIAVNIQNV
ncbi:MAG: hypothetical protein ACOC56_02280 [Atribacterota bacterium]